MEYILHTTPHTHIFPGRKSPFSHTFISMFNKNKNKSFVIKIVFRFRVCRLCWDGRAEQRRVPGPGPGPSCLLWPHHHLARHLQLLGQLSSWQWNWAENYPTVQCQVQIGLAALGSAEKTSFQEQSSQVLSRPPGHTLRTDCCAAYNSYLFNYNCYQVTQGVFWSSITSDHVPLPLYHYHHVNKQ